MPLVVTATPPAVTAASVSTSIKRLVVAFSLPVDPDNPNTIDERIAYVLVEESTDPLFGVVEQQRQVPISGQALSAQTFEEHFVVTDTLSRYARVTPYSADNVSGGALSAGSASVPQSGPVIGTSIDIPGVSPTSGFHVDSAGNLAIAGTSATDAAALLLATPTSLQLRTAPSGRRIEIGSTPSDRIDFYTGSASEVASGYFNVWSIGSAPTEGWVGLVPPRMDAVADTRPELALKNDTAGASLIQTFSKTLLLGGPSSTSADLVHVVATDTLIGPAGSPVLEVTSGLVRVYGEAVIGGYGGLHADAFGLGVAGVSEFQSDLLVGGALLAADGSLGAPGIAFTSDANTGIRRVAADTMALAVGGADALTLSPTVATAHVDASFATGRPWIDVSSDGSVGDGTTDDATHLQTTLSRATAGDIVKFSPRATYLTNTPLVCSAPGVTIDLNGATLKAGPTFSTTADLLTCTGAGAKVRGAMIDGNARARWGIATSGGAFSQITYNAVTGCKVGIRHTNGPDDIIGWNRVYGNSAQGIVEIGNPASPTYRTKILANSCSNNGADTPGNVGWGINVSYGCQETIVMGNTCRDNYQGGITCDVLNTTVTYGTLHATIVAGDGAMDVDETTAPPAAPFLTLIDGEIVNTTARVLVSGSRYTYTITRAQGGTAAAGHTAGVSVKSTDSVILVTTNFVIQGNVCKGVSGSNATHGIVFQGGIGATITGNTAIGFPNHGLFINARNVSLGLNTFGSNGTGDVAIAGHTVAAGVSIGFTPTAGGYCTIVPNNHLGGSTPNGVTEDVFTAGTNTYVMQDAPLTLTDAGTVAINAGEGSLWSLIVAANSNRTIGNPTNLSGNKVYTFRMTNGTGGTYTATLAFGTTWVVDLAEAMPASGKTHTAMFLYDGTHLVQITPWMGEDVSTAMGGTPGLTFSTTNLAGVSGRFLRTDDQIALFDTTNPVTQAFGDTADPGSVAFGARRDHKHGMPADSGNHLYGRKSNGDQTKGGTLTTLEAVTGLDLVVAANHEYRIRYRIIYDATTAADLKFGWTGTPTGATIEWGGIGISTGAGNSVSSARFDAGKTATDTLAFGGAGAGAKIYVVIDALVVTGANGGTIKLTFAQNTSDATAPVVYNDSRYEGHIAA